MVCFAFASGFLPNQRGCWEERILEIEKIDFPRSGRDPRSRIGSKKQFCERIFKEKIDFRRAGRDPRSRIGPKKQFCERNFKEKINFRSYFPLFSIDFY